MKREEMEALIRTITLEVVRGLKERGKVASDAANGSSCGCGCGACKSPNAPQDDEPPSTSSGRFKGRVLTEAALESVALDSSSRLKLPSGTIVTPLARDRAAEMGILLEMEKAEPLEAARSASLPPILCPTNTIAFFSARSSLTHERILGTAAEKAGFEVHRCASGERDGGTVPALGCARLVSEGQCCRGVILTDQVYSVLRQANRLPGVQAEVCWDVERARESRNSDSNLLLLSDGRLGLKMLERILEIWLAR